MRKTVTGLLVLTLSCIGCSTMMNVEGIGIIQSPRRGDGTELGIRIISSRVEDREVVSVDRVADLPVQNSLQPSVQDEVLVPETLFIALIVTSIVRDILNTIPWVQI